MTVPTLRLVKTAAPPLVEEALNKAFLAKLRLANPPAVRAWRRPPAARFTGFCEADEWAEDGEVCIAEDILENRPAPAWQAAERLADYYMHEAAHRLTPGHGHTAAFMAAQLLLFLRAGSRHSGLPWWHKTSLYDLQDHGHAGASLGQALDWSMQVAAELAETDLSAEDAAQEIMKRYERWRAWKAREPERLEAARARAELVRYNLAALQARVDELRTSRWAWTAAALVLGMSAGMILAMLLGR